MFTFKNEQILYLLYSCLGYSCQMKNNSLFSEFLSIANNVLKTHSKLKLFYSLNKPAHFIALVDTVVVLMRILVLVEFGTAMGMGGGGWFLKNKCQLIEPKAPNLNTNTFCPIAYKIKITSFEKRMEEYINMFYNQVNLEILSTPPKHCSVVLFLMFSEQCRYKLSF